jgi:hypothetical protein
LFGVVAGVREDVMGLFDQKTKAEKQRTADEREIRKDARGNARTPDRRSERRCARSGSPTCGVRPDATRNRMYAMTSVMRRDGST